MKFLVILPVHWGGVVHSTLALINIMCRYKRKIEHTIGEKLRIYVVKTPDGYTNYLKSLQCSIKVVECLEKLSYSRSKPFLALNPKNIISTSRNLIILSKLIREEKPDIIYIPGPYPQLLPLIPVLRKYRVALTVHAVFHNITAAVRYLGMINVFLYLLTEVFIRMLNPSVILVHTISDKKLLKYKFKKLKSKIFKVPLPMFSNFEDHVTTPTLSQSREKVLVNRSKFIVLYFGYIIKGKGLNILLKAIKKLTQRFNGKILLIIAGEGTLSKYRKLINSLNRNILILNTYIPEKFIPPLFKLADVIVLPYTFHKGYSGVLKLAITYETPVIGSTAGDLREIIEYNGIGFTFNKGDHADLALKIERLFLNKEELRKIRESIRQYKLSSQNKIIEGVINMLKYLKSSTGLNSS